MVAEAVHGRHDARIVHDLEDPSAIDAGAVALCCTVGGVCEAYQNEHGVLEDQLKSQLALRRVAPHGGAGNASVPSPARGASEAPLGKSHWDSTWRFSDRGAMSTAEEYRSDVVVTKMSLRLLRAPLVPCECRA